MITNKRINTVITILLVITIAIGSISTQTARKVEAKEKTYTVKTSTKPYKNLYMNYSTYNKKTKHYYLLRSYLEKLEKDGGGTLVILKGTYVITNTLYIPSNVTITLKDGVKLQKGNDTGTKKIVPAKSMFQLISTAKQAKANSVSEYNGETGIVIQGEGSATIDLKNVKDTIGLVIGHNYNVTVKGITFQNMYSGHFIEMDASKQVIIENNTFRYHKASESGIKEAINLDTPDVNTQGFNVIWSNHDCTPNKDIIIKNNNFEDLERAIGTHKYTEGKYHQEIQLLNNKIFKTSTDAIRIMNWSNPVVKGNVIEMVANGGSNARAILASGIINPTITENTFIDVARPIQLIPWKNPGAGSQYAITYNDISNSNIELMLKNYLVRVQENFIRVNKTYNVFDKDTDKYSIEAEYLQ